MTKKKATNAIRAKNGSLIIIGGAEDKLNRRTILSEVARRSVGGKIVVITAASERPSQVWDDYRKVFKSLDVKHVEHLQIDQADEARDPANFNIFDGASTIFFTGGDQLRITTKLGGTPIEDLIFDVYKGGGTIAGTSAGASVMGKTMLVGGENTESHKVGNWMMAPGMGFVEEMLIDQHFAQRGRIGRLLGAVALNPGILGIGIDEDTAICVEGDSFHVIGKNAVYIVDGHNITYTNICEASADRTMSMHDVRLHILAENEAFHIHKRQIKMPG